MDDTTTDTSVDNQATDQSQPEETIESSAESLRADQPAEVEGNTDEPSKDDNSQDSTTQTEDDSSKDDDVDLKEWAKKKGVDPDDPEAILKLARDTEKGFRQYSQKAKQDANQLKQQVSQDPGFSDSEAVIQEARVINFYNSNPEAREYDKQMGEIYARFQQSDPEFATHLMKHLDTLYAMAKTESSNAEIQTARQQGRNEAIEAKRKAQAASAPQANAVSSTPKSSGLTPEKVNQIIESGQYDKYRDEILEWERRQYG
jgi:hypothetical protein